MGQLCADRAPATLRWSLALGAVHTLLFTLSQPPIGAGLLVVAAVAPLVVIAMKTERPRRSALGVWLATIPLWLYLEHWIAGVTVAGYLSTAMYLALYPAVFVWIGAHWRKHIRSPWLTSIMFAALWIGLETLKGEVVFNGYAWFLIAHPLIDTPMAQLAQWVGVYGVGFIVVASQSLMVIALMRKSPRRARVRLCAAGAGQIVVAMTLGVFLSHQALSAINSDGADAKKGMRIAVVQTNVPQSNKIGWPIEQRLKDFARFRELTLESVGGVEQLDDRRDTRSTETSSAERWKPDLIIWPETMFPGDTLSPQAVGAVRDAGLVYQGGVLATALYDTMLALQREIDTPILVGAIGYDDLSITAGAGGEIKFDQRGKYNSAFLIDHGAVTLTRYDKLHLTPFGEVMPYISWSDRFEDALRALGAPGMLFDLDEGAGPVVFETTPQGRQVAIATPICFEAATPALCRRLVFQHGRRSASVIVNLTNDGWFGDSAGGREQALQVARWRTIELRTPMIRAANTGISASIDAAGRVRRIGPDRGGESINADGVMRAVVFPSTTPPTLYARFGDWVGWLCLLVVSGRLLLGLFVRLRTRLISGTPMTTSSFGEH